MTDGLFANPLHWVILLVVVLIIFGPGKLPSVGSALGKSIKEFKKATADDTPPARPPATVAPAQISAKATTAPAPATVVCPACKRDNEAEARFCVDCGADLAQPVAAEPEQPAPASKVSCSSCSAENHASNRFCARCGKLLDQVAARV